jgi:dTDP-4-dehydrorhamnose 3,5-epimerase
MEIVSAGIPGTWIIKPKIWGDSRGFFLESYRASWLESVGVTVSFVQDNLSRSKKGTLRGLHFQLDKPQAKLVTVLRGEVIDVMVDVRRGSPTFGEHRSVILSEENRWQLFIPAGFAHGFAVLSEIADFYYKCSEYYSPASERGIAWNDPDLNINWMVDDPLLSEKDTRHPYLKNADLNDLPIYLP